MMKKLCTILLLIALAAPLCGAAAGDGSGGGNVSAAASAAEVLAIDNANIYPGMNTAYKDGYIPVCSGGSAAVVLPLVTAGGAEVLDDKVHVSFDLGDAATSPFQFKNYDVDISSKEYATNNGTKKSYLVGRTFALTEKRNIGRYPLTIHVNGSKADGEAFRQSFTVYVTVTDGIDPNAPAVPNAPNAPAAPAPEAAADAQTPEEPVPEVKILLSKYTVSPDPVTAGEEVLVSFTLFNTSKTQDITNVKIAVSGETTDLIPAEGSGSYYYELIGRQGTKTTSLKLKVDRRAAAKSHKLLLAISYEGKDAAPYKADESIPIPVTQGIRLEYDDPVIAPVLNAGETIEVSSNIMNLGLGMVHNVRIEMAVPGLLPEKTAFLGNIESGASKEGSIYAFVGTLDMTEGGGDEKYGATSGAVTITYEDEFGTEYSEEFSVVTNIEPPIILADTEEAGEEAPEDQAQWWVSVLIAGGIIAAFIAVRVYMKRRSAARDMQDGQYE